MIEFAVDEEYDSHDEDHSAKQTYKIGGGHSMVSTNYTAGTTITSSTNDDDNVQLVKTKKKKGLFKNLFHFGSRKGRSKSASSEPTQRHSKNNDETLFRSPELNRKYLAEQEKINQQYRRLMEEKQWQISQQPPTFVRNQLNPLHQSMPMGHRARVSPNLKSQIDNALVDSQLNGATYQGLGTSNFVHHYDTNVMQRDTVGVPQFGKNDKLNSYLRQNHRIYPEMKFNHFAEANTQVCYII